MYPQLLCTDLDRTLVPNGEAEESPGARESFARVAARSEITLVYVTGRHLESVHGAIREFALPLPDFAICDVGSAIYRGQDTDWEIVESWHVELARSWGEDVPRAAWAAMSNVAGLAPQESERQSRFKLSYYAPRLDDPSELLDAARDNLMQRSLDALLVYSIDETRGIGLLDLLPPASGKKSAVEHLSRLQGVPAERMLFAGDSGNDIELLCSAIPAVLVANAAEAVRREAVRRAEQNAQGDSLYLARGGLAGMNGNYAAGILEGLTHFWPKTKEWIA